MRKLLILGAAMLVSAGIMAQSTATKKTQGVIKSNAKQIQLNRAEPTSTSSNVALPIANKSVKAIQAITKTPIGSSKNCFTLLVSQSNVLTANEDANLIAMTHRIIASSASSSGYIQTSFSTDGGFGWDSTSLIVWPNTGGYLGRYPSGVIYNPTASATYTDAYVVATGPILDAGGTNFIGGFFVSEQFDGTGINQQHTLYTTDSAGGAGPVNSFPRLFLQNRGNMFYVLGNDDRLDAAEEYYVSFETVINKGIWDATGDSVAWSRSSFVPPFLTDASGDPEGYTSPGLIFEDNGTTGWMIQMGRDGDATDNLSYLPMVYKTTDGAGTWVKQTAFDWAAISTLNTIATDWSDVTRPMMGPVGDITLDANGRVHFLSMLHGAASDHPDSLGYYSNYVGINGFLCDIFQTASGWDAVIVDTVWADDPDINTTLIDQGDAANYVAWDERAQISSTVDGSKIFYAWMDTDSTLSDVNIYPDIFVKMYDVATSTMGPRINLTRGTDYDANNYWMYLGDVAYDNGTSYTLHISTSSLNTNSSGPVTHYYMNGVIIDETGSLIESVDEMPLDAMVNMYPNPTSNDLNISFNTNASGNYNVVVYNTLGSVVMSDNVDVNGAVVRTISMENLPTGIYMVEVSNENGISTKKIMKN